MVGVSSEGLAAALSIEAMLGGCVWVVCGGDGGVLRGLVRLLGAQGAVEGGIRQSGVETASECVFCSMCSCEGPRCVVARELVMFPMGVVRIKSEREPCGRECQGRAPIGWLSWMFRVTAIVSQSSRTL